MSSQALHHSHAAFIEQKSTGFDPLQSGINFGELKEILKRRKAIIINITLVSFAAAVLYSLFAAPLYSSTTQILIDPREKRVMENGIAPKDFTSESGLALVESQMKVLTSETMLYAVIERERLTRDAEYGSREASFINGLLVGLGLSKKENPQARALSVLTKNVTAKRSEKAYVVDLKVTSKDADKSARIANSLVAVFLEGQAGAMSDANRRVTKSLTSRLESLQESVRVAENAVEKYKAENGLVGVSGKLVSEQQLTEMNNQLVLARAKTAEYRSKIEQLQRYQRSGGDASAIAEALQSQTITSLRNQIAEATRQESDLLQTLGAKHPQVQSVQRQITDVKKLIAEEVRRVAASVQSDYDRTLANEKSLDKTIDTMKKDQIGAGQAHVRLRELEREVETSRSIYNSFMNRARETSEQERLDTSNIRVISEARPPSEKSWPPSPLLIGLSLALGLGIGTGFALMRESLDDRLYTKRQCDTLGVNLLGSLPALNTEMMSYTPVLALDAPDSLYAQRVRSLMNRFNFTRDKNKLMLLGEANDTYRAGLAMNMALVAAQNGEKVLLIDANRREKALSNLILSQPLHGLSDFIDGQKELAQCLIIDRRTGISFLPFGLQDNAMLTKTRLNEIMPRFKPYSLVIIDGGVVGSDAGAMLLAGQCDDICVTLAFGQSRVKTTRTLLKSLSELRGKLIGVVFTGAKQEEIA